MKPVPSEYEKLGVFYLGRTYDLDAKAPGEALLYDARDLVTHAVCVGMTGSGKTGLCVSLIEEAAIDGIPALVIDPKGDLANLFLTFPELRPADFAPWIDPDEARAKGKTVEALAADTADRWRAGLESSGQDGARIRRLKEAADFALYTPGGSARPLSILSAFEAPPKAELEDAELLRSRISATASSLLALLDIEADPVKSREHILISSILADAWSKGQDLDLPRILQLVQTPPMSKIGVLELESFYPAKDRFELVLALNGLLASPGFGAWLEGEPLDVASLLFTEGGRPRISVLSIAHLGDRERMFFVSLLLQQVLGWMRRQPGTSSLRALFYMDEIFGYFPPVAAPPSKAPLLTLLKQARAFGLGVVLATQNPVDLDYKGLSNAGTWFIGRLQTERDRARILDGLEGAASAAGRPLDRAELAKTISALDSRVFLMNDVHEDGPVVFETRWTLSYLRGPMTREQLKVLAEPREGPRDGAASAPARARRPRREVSEGTRTATAPALPPEITQVFVPVEGAAPEGAACVYVPAVLGAVRIAVEDKKAKVSASEDFVVAARLKVGPVALSWDDAEDLAVELDALERQPVEGAELEALPAAAVKAKSYDAWSKQLVTWVAANKSIERLRSPSLGLVSGPGELERDFRARLQLEARQARDAAAEALRRKYAPKLAALTNKVRRAEATIAREQAEQRQQQAQTAISFGTTVLGALFGRKLASASNIGHAATAARGVARAMKEAEDVGRAANAHAAAVGELQALEAELAAEIGATTGAIAPATEVLETLSLRPTRTKVEVRLLALAWLPGWRGAGSGEEPAYALHTSK